MTDQAGSSASEPTSVEAPADSSPADAPAEAAVEVEDVSSDEAEPVTLTKGIPVDEKMPASEGNTSNGAPAISDADLSVLGADNDEHAPNNVVPELETANRLSPDGPIISEADLSVLEVGNPPQNATEDTANVSAAASVAYSPSPTAAEATAAFAIDDEDSVKTEESADDSSSSSGSSSDDDSDSDSVSTESSGDSSSSSSSEDPSVINGINMEDIIYEEEDTDDEMEDVNHNGHDGNFTIDDEEEEDARDAILLKEDVFPEERSPLYDDDEEMGKAKPPHRSPQEKMMQNRAMVRKMVLQNLKGRRRRSKKGRHRRFRHGHARDIPLHWDDDAAPISRRSRGWTHRNKRRRFMYAMLSVIIFIVGISLMIYGVARQREYSRTQASLADDEAYDDYYYHDDEYDDIFENGNGGSGSLQSPSNARSPTVAPAVMEDDELLELIKLAYKSSFHAIAPTTQTLHIIDLVETDLLNGNVQSKKAASDQSIQWRAYLSLRQRDDVVDKSTNKPFMQEELIWQLYSLTCFFYSFNFAQELDDECQWLGIKCDDVFSDSNNDVLYPLSEDLRVVSISLPNESLTGTLPVELIFLSHLETIDLSNNFISGSLPQYFSQDQLDNLKVLSLHDNRFEGSIPEEMSKLKNLQKLTLQHNELVGEVTTEICDLRDHNLHFLWVDCSPMPNTGFPKVPCAADCCTICFEGFDPDGGPSTGGSSPASQVDTPHIVIGDWSADVKEKLAAMSNDGGMALMDVNSPQFHAYSWLVEDSDDKDYSDERLFQRYALAVLYFSAGGVQWDNNEGWVTSADECNWFGISGCSDANSEAVVSIELAGNNLAGPLPSEFFEYFSDLMVLNLSDNHLTGSIPTSIGSLSNLIVLELAENELTSHVPTEIGNLQKLDHLFLQMNDLEGQMPNEICDLRTNHSFGLSLAWADCNGFPPRIQCKKTCCTTCFTNPRGPVNDNEVEAPTTHADPNRDILSTLKKMSPDGGAALNDTSSAQYKAYNWIAGSDYQSLTDIILLQRYALSTLHFSTAGSGWKENYFWNSDSPECPNDQEHWMGVTKCDGGGMVTHLELPSNRLVGTLPPELSHLRMLEVLDLSDNELYGRVPTQFGQFQELEVLQLSGNFLTGQIPDDLGFVFTLQELYVHMNSFTGSMPDAVCDLKDPLGGIEVLWADCSGEPPLVSCREYCCTQCFNNTSEYIASESSERFSYPTLMPTSSAQSANPTIAENPELKAFLLKHSSGFADSLSDVNLPAYRAYLLIANAENYDDLDPFNILQRFGLITLYLSTTPELDWKVSTGWTSKQHECNWFGISCSDNNTVSEINLPNNRLSGTLPHEIALAGIGEQIIYIDVSGNNIGGKIVSEIGTFKNLAFLDLKANDFTGQIPSQLGHLAKLGSLQLHANELTGTMPQEICDMRTDKLKMLVADCRPDEEFDEVTCEEPQCCTRCY